MRILSPVSPQAAQCVIDTEQNDMQTQFEESLPAVVQDFQGMFDYSQTPEFDTQWFGRQDLKKKAREDRLRAIKYKVSCNLYPQVAF